MPKVSVIIPTCNRPHLVTRAVNSVLSQTFQDFEIIIVDDGMEKRAEEALKAFNDTRIIYIKHEKSKGAPTARNTGIEAAAGEYAAFLDDDDEWLPEKIEKQVAALDNAGKDAGVAFCGVGIYDKNGKFLGNKIFYRSGIVSPFKDILHKCFIWTSAMMVRRELLKKHKFDIRFPKNQEWDLQLRLAKETQFYSITAALVRINVQGEKEHLGGKGNLDNIIKGFEMLLEKHYNDYTENKKSLALRYFQLGCLCKDNHQHKKSVYYFQKACKNNFFNVVYLKYLLMSVFK